MADAVIALAGRLGALDRLGVRSFDWRGLFYLRDRCPRVPLGWLTAPETANSTWRGEFARAGLSLPASVALAAGGADRACWAPDFRELDPDLVAEAHALGLCVVPWTVDEPDEMAQLISWGVEGLCTDRPDLARRDGRSGAGAAAPLPSGLTENGRGRPPGSLTANRGPSRPRFNGLGVGPGDSDSMN